jgi:hypothetical protein
MRVRLQQNMRVNGTPAPGAVAQLLGESGREFSFPILSGEAGFYQESESGRYYVYDVAEPDTRARHLRAVA